MQKYLTRVWAVRYFCISPMEAFPKGSRGRAESPLVAPAGAKSPAKQEKARKTFSLAFHKESVFCATPLQQGPEGFQRAIGKPFGRLRRGETLRKMGRSKEGLFLALHKKSVSCGRFRPPAGGRGTFPHGKVPKGCRGRPKGACLMAAPGPPVAKEQCTASLAGARPAGFTSVPGRATVAFGAADPSPGSWAPVYPWSDGKKPLRQENLVAVRAAVKVPCKVRARLGTRLVAGPEPNPDGVPDTDPVGREAKESTPFGTRGVRGHPSAV